MFSISVANIDDRISLYKENQTLWYVVHWNQLCGWLKWILRKYASILSDEWSSNRTSFTFLAFPHSTFQSFRGFKIAVRNRSRLPKCVGEMTFCLARKSIGFVASASSLFAGTVTPLKTIFGHLKQLKEVNAVIFPVDLWSLNIDSYQEPVSQKSRNISGLSRVPQVLLYLGILASPRF